jgi:ATP-binding protein involved in chromosome partitioning
MALFGKSKSADSLTEGAILDRLRPIQDPDLNRGIVDLGFIKNLKIDGANVAFDLELTTPACPVKDQLRDACIRAVSEMEGVGEVKVNMTARTRGAETAGRRILETVKNVIAVASGKGGVGKSTTAVNLAVALQQTGAAVGVLDADIYGPSIPTMIGIERPPQPQPGNKIVPAEGLGLKLISMAFFMPADKAAILRGPMVSGYVSQFLGNVLWGELDYLVIDYPPGTGDIQLTLSQQGPITGAAIVTTPQDISLVDVRRAIAMFETTRVPVLGVCETMSSFVCDGCGKEHFIFRRGGGEKIASATGVPFLGGVPIDPRVTEGGDTGKPIVLSHPDSPAAEAYRKIAGAVAAQLSILNVERGQYLESFELEWRR